MNELGRKTNYRHAFALLGRPEITGMSDVDGNGVLNIQVKGSAQWLIAAYSTAAPTEDTQYDIGGTLYYTVNGENITVPLFPDTVTVKPDPRLYVYYFLEKYINSDDPLTTGIVTFIHLFHCFP